MTTGEYKVYSVSEPLLSCNNYIGLWETIKTLLQLFSMKSVLANEMVFVTKIHNGRINKVETLQGL